jgi:ribosomal protein S18 acetylase RimI-like enzyme
MPLVPVVRTYLEMTSPDQLRPAPPPEPAPRLERVGECPASFFRYLYAEVGRAFHWTDRLGWDDATIRAYLDDPATSLWLLSWEGAPAGYFELRDPGEGAVEITYFGLLPEYFGRGWGGHLLTQAVESAWGLGASRVWLHTCTLDHPAALPNYLRRGFRRVREETYTANLAPS